MLVQTTIPVLRTEICCHKTKIGHVPIMPISPVPFPLSWLLSSESNLFLISFNSLSNSVTLPSTRFLRCLVLGARKTQFIPIFSHLAHRLERSLAACCTQRILRPRQASHDRFRLCVRSSCPGDLMKSSILC